MKKTLFSLGCCFLLHFAFAQTCQDASVELSATVQTSPPRITLNWVANAGATSNTIYRKPKFTSNWGAVIATLSGTDTQYIDTTANVGTNYEYRVIRQAATYTGYGYINAGIEIPAMESRGNLVLIVDQSMKDTLRHEIAQLIQDISGDGWNVMEIDVDRTASPASVKTAIKALYDEHPAKTKSVFLLGHVPVPYSGDLNPDGHPDHLGAWPADVYYADMNGAWTDNAVNDAVAGDERNRNIPGDGKFDQSQIPTDVELQVGRVDFANMPSFAMSESELLRQYLNKDHAFRHRYYKPVSRGVIDDNFGYFGSEAFASSGYKNLGPLVGPQQVMANDYFTTLADSNYLWSYGCGGGWYQGAGGIGSTADFASSHTQGVFTMLFGSYFGDWDSQDNFLRAPLAQGLTLTNAWSGRPHWVFHPMALGETVGYCAKLTQNNSATYYPSYGARFVSIALMGDPSLRNQMIAPVSKLEVTAGQTGAVLTWNASPDDVAGYNIYRKIVPEEEFTKVNDEPVAATSFVDSCQTKEGDHIYMVRAYGLQRSPSGTYFDMSEGILDTVFIPAILSPIAGLSYSITGDNEVHFINQSLNADAYEWDFGDGATSSDVNPVHFFGNGHFVIKLTASNSCSSATYTFELDIVTAVNEPDLEAAVRVFPNPSSGQVTIQFTRPLNENLQVDLITPEGKTVLSRMISKEQANLDLQDLPGGQYIVEIRTGRKFFVTKLMLLQ